MYTLHPRPQFMRDTWQDLDGQWDYAIERKGAKIKKSGKINVPFAVEAPASGVGYHLRADETLHYHTTFSVHHGFAGKRVILHFDAVDYKCEVLLNGKSAGSHTGGYDPFYFDISALLGDGTQTLDVFVTDPTENGDQQRGKQVAKSANIWYNATSGIWQRVWLEAVPVISIDDIHIVPDIDKQLINVDTTLSSEQGCTLEMKVSLNGNDVVSRIISDSEQIGLPEMKLWSPEDPQLYDAVFTLSKGNTVIDKVTTYFGMRKFSTAPDSKGRMRFMLNNSPLFINGLLDQGYWPDGGLTPPDDGAMLYDIETAKALGFNTLRKHIKREPARWYYYCDRAGMLVMQDMITGGKYIGYILAGVLPFLHINVKDDHYKWFRRGSADARAEYERDLDALTGTLKNAVCISTWVPFNEGWGQFDAARISGKVKRKDPSRLVDHASGWYDQGAGDFRSLHRYVLPLRCPKDKRAVLISEFGGYSLSVAGHTYSDKKSFGYLMYKNSAALTKAYEKLYRKQVIPLVKKGLAGVIYTQITDVEHEVNGLMTYDRKVLKIDENTIRDINKTLSGVDIS